MDFFSSWLTNIVFISVTVTLLNLMLPDTMGKYVKIITGFIVMLVIVQPITHVLNADVYFDNLYLKHTSLIENDTVSTSKTEELSTNQESLTVKVYQEKLTKNIEKSIEETLKMKVKLALEVNENMSEENFGTLKKAHINILEEEVENGLNINIKKIDLGNKDSTVEDPVSKKSKEKINNFFLSFYNLEAKNITISKNE